ncbi:MAG: hypothetical protein KME30_19990 [Iphinoe sp. HA4291-MV1]|jgi:hypothetical protein|nr:hypothetical protein [Iphinoe sp. HA4291-MV1]
MKGIEEPAPFSRAQTLHVDVASCPQDLRVCLLLTETLRERHAFGERSRLRNASASVLLRGKAVIRAVSRVGVPPVVQSSVCVLERRLVWIAVCHTSVVDSLTFALIYICLAMTRDE